MILETAAAWIVSGPLGGCLESPLVAKPPFALNPDDDKLARLLPHLADPVCQKALNDLRRLFAMIATPNQTISTKTLAFTWLAGLSERFLVLLAQQNTEAVIVMAHYSVLLNMVNDYWFMKGWGVRLLRQCSASTEGTAQELISWPLSLLNLDSCSAI